MDSEDIGEAGMTKFLAAFEERKNRTFLVAV